ncbi:hypothetical protein [Dyella tabacisoli]|uniref:Uncharacterized protein n=1 Tax=Dyella tabacisoli TaxID=2282381 RepID=A0A369UU30_9GAMM|nr:hypothetical protein [Dyella tabacisoli]RDD83110.1 hypothetical protein DVJ77_00365 [Dyella tabacisoli]
MKQFSSFSHARSKILAGTALAAIIGTMTMSSAYAAAVSPQLVNQYADMCAKQSINIPSPYGEADLKGNPKLDSYCKCFAGKFAERAMATLQTGDTATFTPNSLNDSVKQENQMRNSCRQQVGLPLLKFAP